MTTASSMVRATPKSWAILVVTGAAIMAATPAIAEFTPIMVEEMPRFSRMIDSSGSPRPMATPTALMAEIAAISEGQWMASASSHFICDMTAFIQTLE